MDTETWELLSYVVTTIGLPLAIVVFLYEQKKERDSDEEEVYQLLSDNYQDFLKIALDNPDLRLFSAQQIPDLDSERRERRLIIFNMLISLFERAYLLLYEEKMTAKQRSAGTSSRSFRSRMSSRCTTRIVPRCRRPLQRLIARS